MDITVLPLPIVNATVSPNILCYGTGESAIMQASGANTYTWIGITNNSSVSVNPAQSTSYTVLGTNIFGCENAATVLLEVDECLDNLELTMGINPYAIHVFPNPTSGKFFLVTDLTTDFECVLLNTYGQEILHLRLEGKENEIDLSEYPAGVYQLLVYNQNGVQRILKLIKL